MSEPHVVSALRAKRAEIAGAVQELEGQLARQRLLLASLDATLSLFAPEIDPTQIEPKRKYKRSPYYVNGELARAVSESLRVASVPITAGQIADTYIEANALPIYDQATREKIAKRIGEILRKMRLQGAVTRNGTSRDSTWELALRRSENPS